MPDQNEKLEQLLREEISYAEELLGLFRAEKTALTASDHAALLQHTGRKERLVGKLQEATAARTAFMEGRGREHGTSVSGDTETGRLFASLERLAGVCAAENRSTGLMIHRHSQFIRNILDSLQGRSPASCEATYQADGRQETPRRHLQNYATV